MAWDCACGNGQVAVGLAEYFGRIEATDVSAEQISNAPTVEGVHFSVSESESTPFDDQSFDLVCVGQALHWFDYDRFWSELDRVLKPGGVLRRGGMFFRITIPGSMRCCEPLSTRSSSPIGPNAIGCCGTTTKTFRFHTEVFPHHSSNSRWSGALKNC
ncbi:class I SAM-dependent methyltransferase [Botrimarina colliarenosi]